MDLQAHNEKQEQEDVHSRSVVTAFKQLGEEDTPIKTGYEDAIETTRKELAGVTRRIDVAGDLMSDEELRAAYASKANLTRRLTDLEARHANANRTRAELEQAREDCRTARCQ